MPANICTMLFSQFSLYKLRRAMSERTASNTTARAKVRRRSSI